MAYCLSCGQKLTTKNLGARYPGKGFLCTKCARGASKTRIVYQANLNFLTVKPYLDNLARSGFIEVAPEKNRLIYRTTPKGLELKERFEQFHSEISKLYTSI